MADIELVIKIPENYYNGIKSIPDIQCDADMLIIKYGTPLPKCHGRLVDADAFERRCMFDSDIEDMQPVTPQPKWIPVSSGILPKGYQRILVTKRMFHWANEPAEYSVGIESFSGNIDFVAWMPLPEPYEANPAWAESEG